MMIVLCLRDDPRGIFYSKVRAWIVPVPGEFHASEAAHLVAVADKDGDQVLSKKEVDAKKIFLLCLVENA